MAGFASLACFGLAQIVGQQWFKWAILGLFVVLLGIAVWWAYRKYQDGRLMEATRSKTEKLSRVVANVVPVLDRAYEDADDALKQVLDAKIFSKLSTAMDKADKVVVHEVRAEAVSASPST